MIGADRSRPVAQVGLQPHQCAIAGLLQRLQLDPAPRGLYGPGQISGLRPRRAGQVAQLRTLAFQF